MTSGGARLGLALALWGSLGCSSSAQVGSDCDHEDCQGVAGSAAEGPSLPEGRLAVGEIDKVDLLLVIDDSASMMMEQQAFTNAVGRFIGWLGSGELDGSGSPEFYAPSDLHVGVVSSDLGLSGGVGIEQCREQGDDGQLQTGSCGGDSRYEAAVKEDIGSVGMAVVCRTDLGTGGCGFEQLLAAALRALSGAPDGHRDDVNEGFLRDDSLLVVLVVSDEDDCSLPADYELLDAANANPDGDPRTEEFSLGCMRDASGLSPATSYADRLLGLRTSAVDRTMFFAIAGVPPELTGRDVVESISLEDTAAREGFYDAILSSPLMQQNGMSVDPGVGDAVQPVCTGDLGPAYPGRRLVEAAREFGVNGLVQSICNSDLMSALDVILRSVARRLGPPGL